MLAAVVFFLTTWVTIHQFSPLSSISFAHAAPNLQSVLTDPDSGRRGAVATEARECSKIGRDILLRGGNAVDAAVGSTFCVGVIAMYHSGISGGGFMMVRGAYGNYESVNFRETAPAAATEDMYKHNISASHIGGMSVAVPGELKGLEYVHKKYGTLPWAELLQGAIHLSRDGFTVSSDLIRYSHKAMDQAGWDFLVEDPDWAVDFAPNGTLVKEGDIMTRRRYADTLQLIADHGADIFYSGPLAQSLVDTARKDNGIITVADFAAYQVSLAPPLNITFRGHTLFTVPAPSGGAAALNILKVMEHFPAEDARATDLETVGLSMHRIDEAMRFAFGSHLTLGDPSFVQYALDLQRTMVSEERARAIRSRILDDRTQPVEKYNPDIFYPGESHGTSHIVTADASGMAVSLTTSINDLYGSLLIDPVTGVPLNNEMGDFSSPNISNIWDYPPSPSNFIRPHKRPLSSNCPILVENSATGELVIVIGAAGGSRILTSTAQVLWRVLEQDSNLADAITHPRIHDQLLPNVTKLEHNFDPAVAARLADRGHEVVWMSDSKSAVQGILRRGGDGAVFEVVSEPRQKNALGLAI